MENTRNLTIALPQDLVRDLKILAAKRGTSISGLLISTLKRLADEERGYDSAREAMLADLNRGHDLGTNGRIDWIRDSLHER